jgi:hypothetical protein
MTADELKEALRAGLEPGAALFVERRGDDYSFALVPEGTAPPALRSGAEAWLCYTGRLPSDQADFDAFFADLLAELDAMALPGDRCRWPLDQPFPHGF